MEKNSSGCIKYWILICGILSVVFYLLHDLIGARAYSGYNWMAQAVSDLTAVDAPSSDIAGRFSHIHGIFSCVTCAFIFVAAKTLWNKASEKVMRLGIYLFVIMHWVSAIGYSLFPLTGSGYDGSFQSFVHVFVVTVLVVLLSIVSLILISVGGFKSGNKVLTWLAAAAFLLMFLGAAGSSAVPKEYFGVVERFSTYSAVVFTAVLAVCAFAKFKEA